MAAHPAPLGAPDPTGRPRTVVGAFYCWVVGAVLTAALGLLMLVQTVSTIKVIGVLLIVVALAQGFLADRARKRDVRFARAAVGLAAGTIAFLALIVLFLAPAFVVVVMMALAVVLLIVASVLNQGKASQDWYHAEGSA